MSAVFYFFLVLYTCIFCFGQYIMTGPLGRRRIRQAVKYVYVALKMLVAVAISPLLLLCFFAAPKLFLPVFTFLWPHLDVLGEDGSLYLRRWFMTPKTQWFRPRFLHYIARSDEGRDPHDHPGKFRTKILKGGYYEHVYFPRRQCSREELGLCHVRSVGRGDILDNPAGHTHMVKLFEPTWTWVVGWIRGKPWGFWVLDPVDSRNDYWIESEKYGVKGVEVKSWEIRT
jgi:hypothetical protein